MKNIFSQGIKKVIAQELLMSEGFLGNGSQQNFSIIKNYLLGFRKEAVIYDIEKSIVVYTTVLKLTKLFDNSKLKILFVGSPKSLENYIPKIIAKSNHNYIADQEWVPGMLTNEKIFPDLIVCFKNEQQFSNKECFKKQIPLISFVDESCNLSNIDFPIMVNLKSTGAAKMYLNLVKQLIFNSNVKR